MSLPTQAETAEILKQSRNGERAAIDKLVATVYDELKALAARHLRGGQNERALTPTVLVHEAYVKLVDQTRVEWKDRAHFIGVSSHLMRRALLEHVRAELAQKRGGGRVRITLHDGLAESPGPAVDLLALEDALAALEKKSERKAKVVELRFFGGLTMEEAAEVLGVSKKTVESDWYFARAWLSGALK